mmetsp:Transcript_28295/g.85431  ORF Transcript_28295/g.85431 Transcript_28295/m.85431 type:complete len:324 (+) Transcript_28295:1-972(+)
MASALNKVVQTLVQQGTHKEGGHVLPHWIHEGAKLSYHSQRSGQPFDVVVEGISHSKQQVRFVFEADRKTWKSASIPQILAGHNPLRRREPTAAPVQSTDEKPEAKESKPDAEGLLSAMEKKWKAEGPARRAARPGGVIGPKLSKVPRAWEQPDVLDVDSSPERGPALPVQDLDAEEPAAPVAREEADPYGLGEQPATAAPGAPEVGAARSCGSRAARAGPGEEAAASARGSPEARGRGGAKRSGSHRKARPTQQRKTVGGSRSCSRGRGRSKSAKRPTGHRKGGRSRSSRKRRSRSRSRSRSGSRKKARRKAGGRKGVRSSS